MIITDIGTYPGQAEKSDIVLNSRMKIDSCTMCMDCWYRTPHRCTKTDGLARMGEALERIDEMVIVSRCFYGSFSSFVKKILDRCTPYLKPGYETVNGKVRHAGWSDHVFTVSAYFYGENINAEEQKNARKMVHDTAFSLHAEVKKIVFVEDPWAIGGMEG